VRRVELVTTDFTKQGGLVKKNLTRKGRRRNAKKKRKTPTGGGGGKKKRRGGGKRPMPKNLLQHRSKRVKRKRDLSYRQGDAGPPREDNVNLSGVPGEIKGPGGGRLERRGSPESHREFHG